MDFNGQSTTEPTSEELETQIQNLIDAGGGGGGGGTVSTKFGFPSTADNTPFYSDANITFGWDTDGGDIECFILTVPTNGVRSNSFLHGTIQDTQVAMTATNTLYDLFSPGITQGEVCEIWVSAYDDTAYPMYNLIVHNTGTNINAVVEKIG